MVKLKTLKDFPDGRLSRRFILKLLLEKEMGVSNGNNIKIEPNNGIIDITNFIYKPKLKREAIKHIKELNKLLFINGKDVVANIPLQTLKTKIFQPEINHTICWIKKFFNITKRDLKE